MKFSPLALIAVASLASASALAEETKTTTVGAAPTATVSVTTGTKYGTAGCGLGSVIFGNKPGIIQIFAATTNGTSGNQTFGITSGTSNCTDTSGGAASAKAFIETNRVALAKEISRGSGETISSLAALAGCSDAAAVGVTLQKNFKSIYPTEKVSNDAVTGSILSTLKSDGTLSCRKLS